jgi:hypothetical protein
LQNVELLNSYPTDLKFLLYIEENSELKIPKDIEENYSPAIYFYKTLHYGQFHHFTYFLNEIKDEVKLSTLEMFTENFCNDTQIVTLNTFNKKSRKWKSDLNIPEKFTNFHNCTIVCGVYVHTQASYIDTVTDELEGIVPNLMRAVAPKLNFSLILQMNRLQSMAIDTDVRPLNAIQYYPHLFLHVISAIQWHFHLTTSFDENTQIFVITPGEKYSSYEKLFLPFDVETWTYLAIVFGVAFLTVFIINLTPEKVKNLVFGKGIKTPSYNIVGSFFGISQNRLPNENSPRILLMYFVIFCLIFRTAYQGENSVISLNFYQ